MESPFSDMDWLDTASNTLDLAIQKGLYTEFSHLKSDLDRIRFIHNHRTSLLSNTFERYLSSTSSCLTKNATTAINFRKKGNDYFVEKDLSRAAWCYRASIALSTSNSQDMALSYGNLSAVLFELNHYHESIRAIQLANDYYPTELKFKLVFRRAACYHKLSDPERSAYELKICRDLIKRTAGLDRKKIDSFCKEMDQLSRQIAILNKRKEEEAEEKQEPQTMSYKNLDDLIQNSPTPTETIVACLSKSTEEKATNEFCPPSPPSPPRSTILVDESKLLLNGSNKYVPCASSTLRVANSKDKGRHIVANQDIPSDVLVLNERPYACLLLPKFAYTYCDHCLTSIVIPYVCPQCSHVLFCSEHCQQRALASYHQYECKHIHILKTLGIAFLAYRTLTITDHETLWTTITQTTIPNDNEEQNKIYKSDYVSIQKLITHTEQMSIDDLFHYSLTAYLLSEIIKSTNFLRCNQIKKRDTEQILLASILLKHIQQMICNAQTISITKTNQMDDIIFDNDDDRDEVTKRFASAIFPTCALMNHSCVPNIRCIFDQGHLRVYTAKPIRQGEEILNCYGPQKSLMPSIEQRQNVLLEQYFFKCQCEGCVEIIKPHVEPIANGEN
ncbi:unnamed protein product [Rotaria socialis]|uniref:Protein-lysine N-methyltransferase SMYD4 n=1 Tax=Rotaria socialis TaxID=392032 RepID=A0A820GRV5_9BILA|nr:unnamed protein product [Rotaria socialis]CAF3318924.1 unnamed protein product [Rotaria socialis]CAF3335694.1 unnamed protein product [Rotaria socialis]CAF3346952.1 unnamed protein product [Rotaria socialis]CAF3362424.1 unnamed protein product [Rotaria socialis]